MNIWKLLAACSIIVGCFGLCTTFGHLLAVPVGKNERVSQGGNHYAYFKAKANVLLQPEYAKWGRMAMKEAEGRQYQVLDYKYIGKKQISPGVDAQMFKFWVRKESKEFGLYVTIQYHSTTDKVIRIELRESRM